MNKSNRYRKWLRGTAEEHLSLPGEHKTATVYLLPVLIFFLILTSLQSPTPLSAQENSSDNKKESLVTLSNPELVDNRGDMWIQIHYQSPLPDGATVRFFLFNAVKRHLVQKKVIKVKGGGNGTVRFGPFRNLWKSTYRVETTFKKHENEYINWDKYKQYKLVSKHTFTSVDNAPSPEQQRDTFHKRYRNSIYEMREYFLTTNWEVRKLREKLRQDSVPDSVTRKKEELKKDLESLFTGMRSELSIFWREYGATGCPYSRYLEHLRDSFNALARFGDKMTQTLDREWTPPNERYKNMTVSQRVHRKIASPEDLRIYFLDGYFRLQSTLPDPTRNAFQKISSRVTKQLRNALEFVINRRNDGDNEEGKREAAQKRDRIKKEIKTLADTGRETVNRLLWLYRDRDRISPEQKSLRTWGEQIKGSLSTLGESVKNLSDEQKEIHETGMSLIHAYHRLLWRNVENSIPSLKEFIDLVTDYTDVVTKGPYSDDSRKQRLLQYVKKEVKTIREEHRDRIVNNRKSIEENRGLIGDVLEYLSENTDNSRESIKTMKKSFRYLNDVSGQLISVSQESISAVNSVVGTIQSGSNTEFSEVREIHVNQLAELRSNVTKLANGFDIKSKELAPSEK